MKKKMLSVLLATAMALGTISTIDTAVYAVDGAVNTATSAPVNLQVPNLAYDDDSITLIWEKGQNYENIVDYNVYQNGKLVGTAKQNFAENSKFTNAYIDAFYAKDTNNEHTKIQNLSFKATGLNPDTEYTFTVKGVLANGTETEASNTVVQKTTPKKQEFNILDYGAKDTGRIIDYKGREAEIKANTKAIQSAIDACAEGGKVVIPAGTYTSGSLWLKSNITIELQKGAVLSGSTNADDYEQNYLLRNYSTDRRTWGLLNAFTEDGSIENIRIVGEGIIDGNGWKYDNNGTFTTEPSYQEKDELDPAGAEYNLPVYAYGSNSKVYNKDDESKSYGLLAADACKKAQEQGYTLAQAYSTRPTLMIMKGVEGVYLEDITVTNPAFHGMSFGECNNLVVNSIKDFTFGNNNGDGIGIDSTSNCLVFNSTFDTGDDAINFASGLGALSSYNDPAENVRIFNNFVRQSHGGIIAAGSHTGAGIKNILAEDNVSNHSDTPFRFKSAPVNGGGVSDVLIRDNAVANPNSQAFMFTTKYNDPNQILTFEASEAVAKFENISIKNVTVSTNTTADPIKVEGAITDGHNNIDFDNVKFMNFQKGNSITGLSNSTFDDVIFTGSTPKNQWKVSDSKNLKFTGTTEEKDSVKDAKEGPAWTENPSVTGNDVTAQSVKLSWSAAKDNVAVKNYIVKTYVGNDLADTQIVGNVTEYTETGLMPGVAYKFVVEAEDATGNRTDNGPNITVTTASDDNFVGIKAPADTNITVKDTGYTWTSVYFNPCTGDNVRKYEIYANGEKGIELLNASEQNGMIKNGLLQASIGKLKQGTENIITVKALDDKGNTIEYTKAIAKTWDKFDDEAPSWAKSSELKAVVDGNSVKLSWPAANDDNAILGYRVYVNGKVQGEGEFNQANRTLTTTDTSYEIKDLEPGTYTFKVEAGDTWWRSASTEVGIAAPTNWSGQGPIATVEIKAPSTDAEEDTNKKDETTDNVSGDNNNSSTEGNKEDNNASVEDSKDNTNKENETTGNASEDNNTSVKDSKDASNTTKKSSKKASAKTGDKVLKAVAGIAALMIVSIGGMFLSKKKED